MHFLLKNALFRKMHFSRKPHFFCTIFLCRDRGPKYLFRYICEIQNICAGIAFTNEITQKQIFHAERIYIYSQ